MVHKTSKAGRRRTRKMKGGYYSFSGAVGTGAPNWTRASEMPTPDYVSKGGRRRRSRKGGNVPKPPGPPVKPSNTKSSTDEARTSYPPMQVRRRGARRRTRKLKGGSRFGTTSASYQGSGSRGIADFVAVNTKGPYVNGGSSQGAFNDYGAKPGSSF